jgi:hypothetical protein
MAMAKRGSGDAMLDRVTGLGPLIINARNDKNLQQLLDVKQLNSDLEASAGIAAQLADTACSRSRRHWTAPGLYRRTRISNRSQHDDFDDFRRKRCRPRGRQRH